jgi:Proliferating cell nuclear antigen, N-terminal domain.
MSIFKAEIDVGIIENAVRAASILVDEAKTNINEEGMQIRAVDLANVCMVSISLKALAFDYYDASPLSLGLNLTRTADLLKSAKKANTLRWSIWRRRTELNLFWINSATHWHS